MAEMAKLLDALLDGSSAPKDLSSFEPSLRHFHSLLASAVRKCPDGRLGFQLWTPTQVAAVVSAAKLIVSAYNSVELLEPTVLGIVAKSIELCTSYLEVSDFDSEDLHLENDIAQLLELALIGEGYSGSGSSLNLSGLAISEVLSAIQDDFLEVSDHIECNYQVDGNCWKEGHRLGRVLVTSASGLLQQDAAVQSMESSFSHVKRSTISFVQHWAVVHIKCVHRILAAFKDLLHLSTCSIEQTSSANFQLRILSAITILKILGKLMHVAPYVAFDSELLNSVVCCADSLCALLRYEFEFGYCDKLMEEDGNESQVLLLLEDFIRLVQIIFGDGCIFQNIRTCIVASMMDALDDNLWNYNGMTTSPNPPIVYFPKIMLCFLRHVRDIKNLRPQACDLWEKFNIYPSGSFDPEINTYSCDIGFRKVTLLNKYSQEEHLRLIFHQSNQGTKNLIHAGYFLHSEGVKSRLKMDRLCSIQSKSSVTHDSDNPCNHEDDALFGDLFSEATRPLGSSDGRHEQSSSCTNIPASNCLLYVSTEVLTFLKTCIFSREWNAAIYDDACKKMDDVQISFLLSILSCQVCLCDDKSYESSECPSAERNINAICFDLFQNLFSNSTLSSELQEHLVGEILKVENAKYSYNDYTLALLAHVFISSIDATPSQLITNAYKGLIGFILEKIKNVNSCFLELEYSTEFLPSIFHLEILLMGFHLSSDAERASLATILFNSIKSLDPPSSGCSAAQLSLWGLLASRLLLVMQHMLLFPNSCPSWLLRNLKFRLGEVSLRPYSSANTDVCLLSWTATAVKGIMGNYIKDATVVNNLLPHLADFGLLPCIDVQDTSTFADLKLNITELRSSLFWILSSWEGRKAETVDDLIVERYIFLLCWNTAFILASRDGNSTSLWKDLDLSTECFFYFGTLLLKDTAVGQKVDFSLIFRNFVSQLQSALKIDSQTDHGWDFLRSGSWLSLVLSLINFGIWKSASRDEIDGLRPPWNECMSGESAFAVVAENIIDILFKENRVGELICILSSFLKMHLEVLQEAFLIIFDHKKCFQHGFSPMLLLKHACYDGSNRDELLGKCGTDSTQLDFVFGLLSKLDGITQENYAGCKELLFFRRIMLHGVPCYTDVHSAAYVSSILIIQDIVYTLDGLLKVRDKWVDSSIEVGRLYNLLSSIMTIKSDKIFYSIHDKCGTIYADLVSITKSPDFSCLFQLKDIRRFISSMDYQDISDSCIHETLVTAAIELLERLKQESSKTETFELYLNPDGLPVEAKDIFGSSHSDLLVLLSALDKGCCEAIIVKVLNFFVELFGGSIPCPGLKEKVMNKFVEMDLPSLSQWIVSRLLGSTSISPEGGVITEGSLPVREATMNFLTCLTNQTDEVLPRKFHCRLVEAMLISLDNVFISYDIYTAKSFFKFLLQFLNGMPFIKKLLERIAPLMQKLGKDEGSLQVLKYLVGFLRVVLGDCGAHTNIVDTLPKKLPPNSNFGAGFLMTGQAGVSKKIDNMVLADTQGTTPVHLDCEVISADEDEDDGTSDGEIASIEKDEDDDSNSERTLASKVCTFTSSGSNFMEQHWYFCYTCDLTVSKGCCSVCAKVCHKGHRVVYSRSSRFFCDCGAGGVRGNSCQCLKPRKFAASNGAPVRNTHNLQSFLPLSEVGDLPADSESDLDEDIYTDIDSLKLPIPREVQEGLASLFVDLGLEDRILELCDNLLPSVTNRRDLNISKEKKVTLGVDEMLSYSTEIFQLKKSYKGGSFDLKIRADYSNSRELKSHLSSGSLAKSLLTVSARGRLAVGEGDKVSIFDVGQLIGQQSSASAATDKPKPLSKNTVRFEIVHIMFNPVMENYLLVAGYDECQVLTVNPRGEVTDRLAVELAVQSSHIRRVCWVPGSQVQLLVVTNMFVKIYDLSQDNISPIHYFTLESDSIVDGALVAVPIGKFVLLVLSELGSLFRLELSMECNVGAKPLKDVLEVPRSEAKSRGLSLHYSPSHRFLFLSYENGTTLIGRLNANASLINEVTALHEDEHEGKLRSASLHHWKDLLVDNGVFVCFSSLKQNAALSISLRSHEIYAQNMRHPGGSSYSVVGVATYKPLSKDRSHCLVLHDDGSLQIYLHEVDGGDTNPNSISDQARKVGAGILSNKAYAAANPEFPLDFFEKTMCITADVKLSSEAIRNSDSEGAKQRLASEDGFLESPMPAGFKISVSNTNPDIVMVGFRVHIGNTSPIHIPSDIVIFHRKIKLDEGMRSWYDVPFTVAESLLADEEFVISVGPTFDGSSLPRIDSLEVYGRSKDDFGWKEKMDTILAMEAEMLGSSFVTSGSGKKCLVIKSSSVHEQLLADALKLLSKLYSLRKNHICTEVADADTVLDELKCKKILEMIFESDGEPLLHSAACHVLQAIFPKRETYYHVKDTMCLLGVIKSSHELASWIGFGGAATKWAIKEFTAKIRTVSKITLLRRSTMVAFLESHGSEVVDELMQVIWGIFDLDQPDTQTINSVIIPSVELIYGYAECLAFHGTDISGCSVAPAVKLLLKLIFAPYEPVQTSSSLAISSRLLQVPFPKQTMLATDDSIENPPAIHSRIDATNSISGNVQPFLEEDSGTSSVQYCCDGCSTVPILRRRWHCDVCPDFDLCEACYEVMDADRLPPPHSKDHPMSAIPIEVDSLGGDGTEIQFSMDELGDSSLSQVPVNDGMHVAPLTRALESNGSGEFPPSSTDQRIVSISASKRAVNSLLILQLIEELKGWMVTTSGIRAIPVMQLFYRLSSAVGGPFTDCSKPENLNLGKFVKWLLDEINLDKPFVAKNRTSFDEVTILVFMFFTLMLRNWHQPGGDSSHLKPSGVADAQDKNSPNILSSHSAACSKIDQERNEFASQLYRACSYLRQQNFINYLMDILHQLVPLFKFSTSTPEGIPSLPSNSGCGSLLTVRKELPAGNFSPFFSDSYAKAHRLDLFVDYHKLLLENTFRLVYSLVRPEKQDRSADKDKIYRTTSKDLKLDGYQDVLCNYISNPNTSFVRRYARRLFLHLCGSKSHYYNVRDSWQFSHEVKRLYKLVSKSGGLKNAFPYERSAKLVKCLSTIAEVAVVRPRNWQKYCSKHGDILSFLIEGVFFFSEESVIQSLKLLNLALFLGKDTVSSSKPDVGDSGSNFSKSGAHAADSKKKRKADDGLETPMEKLCLDMEHAVGILFQKEVNLLRQFIDMFLLDWNSSSVRGEAKCVLYGAWHHGKPAFKEALLTSLLQKIKCLPMFGQNIIECCELLTMLLGKVPDSAKQLETEVITKCLTADVINCIFGTLHSQNELLANHPNSRIYNTLSALVEFDGYFLESEPCVACSCPEVPYSRMKLETLKFETKYTDNRIIVKCTGSYTIQSLTMNVHDARKSKSVKVLNLYYNNRPVSDLSELKNNWTLWKRAKSCHLAFSQTELKIEFPIPITACNFMIELDSFYENLQASSLEALQCPRCSRPVTDKHGICSNCHENAYQCRQCRNINYENLDSFLCNECGYSKYGRFEFNFMARPSFIFDSMENDEDMKKGLAAIDSESENAHRRYQQLMGFKKPLLKLVSSIGEHEMDSQQKDTVQQLMVSLPGPSCKINRKVALLGMLYGEKCKSAFDSVSKSVQTLQGLRRVLMSYLQKKSSGETSTSMRFTVPRSPNNCYGCATTFVTHCMDLLHVLCKLPYCRKQLVAAGILSELFENNIHQGPKTARTQARAVLCAFTDGDSNALDELNNLIQKKVMYCIEHHRSMDVAQATREELLLLSETCAMVDDLWESRLRIAFQLLFASIRRGSKHPVISEHIILPCLRIVSQACTPPKSEASDQITGISGPGLTRNDDSTSMASVISGNKSTSDSSDKHWDVCSRGQDIPLVNYSEWERGASYLDFVRRQYKISQAVKASSQRSRQGSHRADYLTLKYGLRWKHLCCKRTSRSDFSSFGLGCWVSELILSSCSQSIRAEVCNLINLLCPQNSLRRFQLLNLLMTLLPATLSVGECSAEYFELFFKVIDSETSRLFLTAKGCLGTICRLISQEVENIESQERSLNIDISQGFIIHKLVELLSKFLELPNIRFRFMRDELLSRILESLIVIRGLVVQKTKLISDCNKLLKDLLDSLLLESNENKRQFIRACISGLQVHSKDRKGRTCLFILEQLCNIICPSKPEPVYHLILSKAHTQEEFIRGSMTKNPYSSSEIGPLMRDVKNKICHQLDLLGLLEDDYGMELLVAGNIISLDLSISQVYEQVWKKSQSHAQSALTNTVLLASGGLAPSRDCPPMTVTYRLQGLDGEATEPMIKELEEEREESLDPEIEFAIAGAVRDFRGLEIILEIIQNMRDDDLKRNREELGSVLNLLMYCCKIQENRRVLLRLGALGLLLETARRAFFVDAMEPAEGILLIVESLTIEANESDVDTTQCVTVSSGETGTGDQAEKIVLMFLERLSHSGLKRSNKQQRNNEMVARILPYLTYGEPAAMYALVDHFNPYLQDWDAFDFMLKQYEENPKNENFCLQASEQRSEVENFVRVSESLRTSSCGERLKDIILEKGITTAAVKHLRKCFAVTGQAGFKTTPEWQIGLKLPSVPLILSMLRGLSKGHLATQNDIDEGGILPLLHALEGVPGENEIGARAENLLDTLADKEKNGDGFLGKKVHELRHATRNEMRQRALRKREELLQGLGMRQGLSSDGGERIFVARPLIDGLEDVEEEEDGLACMVCREGYTLRPNDMLGVYSFSKRVNLGPGPSGSSRGECVYTTVSHFNIIHFQCHQEAKRADAALKNPKKEWEGATLRNNETLCNAIFPLKGPSVPLAQYVRYVDQYWDNLSALGRADGSRLRLLTYDIVLMLARFATGASFSTDSKGGGRESNSRFLPFMIQMACHLLDQGTPGQQCRAMAKSISTYLSSTSIVDSPTRSSALSSARLNPEPSDETVQFMMVNSLLTESYEEWSQHLLAFLQRGIYHAYMQHTHGRSTLRLSSDLASSVEVSDGHEGHSSDNTNLFPIIHQMLVYTGLIEQLQRFFKHQKAASGRSSKELEGDSSDSGGSLEGWEIAMREKLVNMKEMISFSKELLLWLEDMTTAGDLQEAFDVMGVLETVLKAGYSTCDDYVRAVITSGRS